MLIAVIATGIAGSGSVGTAVKPDHAGAVSLEAVLAPKCPSARKAVRFYHRRYNEHRAKMGAPTAQEPRGRAGRCPRYLAQVWQRKAYAARKRYAQWRSYHFDWPRWLPDKWARIGACETGYGRRPGQWTWNSGTYQGAFGFYHGSWDAFVPHADPKAGPYPSEAYLATPRQQYEVALAIYRRFGFSGWGCRGA